MNTLTLGTANYPHTLPAFTYQLDHKYMINVTGAQQDALTLSPVEDKGVVDINGIFGL